MKTDDVDCYAGDVVDMSYYVAPPSRELVTMRLENSVKFWAGHIIELEFLHCYELARLATPAYEEACEALDAHLMES